MIGGSRRNGACGLERVLVVILGRLGKESAMLVSRGNEQRGDED